MEPSSCPQMGASGSPDGATFPKIDENQPKKVFHTIKERVYRDLLWILRNKFPEVVPFLKVLTLQLHKNLTKLCDLRRSF